MTPFKAPIEDIMFSLTAIAGAGDLDGWDSGLCQEILDHFGAFAEGVIAPLNEPGDLQGCRLENGSVRMPDGFRDAFAALAESGWQGLSAPEEFGGMEQDHLIAAAVSEVFSGANHAMQMICNLVPGAISTLLRFGSDAQQQDWIPRLASGAALSTMCLTEPGAGSDLSRVRTKAEKTGDGWSVTGEKIFISGGDQDLSEDILHLVLARTGDRDAGVKGLSLFLCGKADAGHSIKVPRIEEKLGLHASPTCHMVFDNAPAQLVGNEGDGLKAMFTVMNHARIDVALQGVAHATRAHAIADAYARDRRQGRKPDGTEATLADHADVRRMLGEQRALSLGARAMAHITLVEMEKGNRPELVEFLTSICKVFCTEAGIRAADLAIQILGGYGYLTEYGVSQIWRDARITSIYEGANGIHCLTLATRGLRTQGGAGAEAFDALIGEITQDADVMQLRDTWRNARTAVSAMDDPSECAFDFAQLSADLFYRAIWAKFGKVGNDPEYTRLRQRVAARLPQTVGIASGIDGKRAS